MFDMREYNDCPTTIPTPRRPTEPPLKKSLLPSAVRNVSSCSSRQVSATNKRSNWHPSTSARKSWNLSMFLMLCKFLEMTCKWTNSMWSSSFAAGGCTKKHQIEKGWITKEQSWPKMATIYFVSRFATLKNITKPIKTKHGFVKKNLHSIRMDRKLKGLLLEVALCQFDWFCLSQC